MKRNCLGAVLSMGMLLALGASAASADVIYDGSGATNDFLLYTTNNPNGSFGDDLTLATDHGDQVIRQVTFGFVVPPNTAVPDCDALVTFYDVENGTAGGTTVALTTPVGAFRVHTGPFAADPNARGFFFDSIDITGVIPAGISLGSDGSGGVSISFVNAGSNPPTVITGVTICPALNAGPAGAGGGVVNPGSNHTNYFYLDGFAGAPEDLSFTGAERVGFGGAFATSNFFWLLLGNTTFPVPANDLCTAAISVNANSQTDGDSRGSTNDNQTICITPPFTQTAGGVWYNVVGTGETILIDLCSASYDSIVAVYCGDCAGTMTCVAADDDGCGIDGGGSTLQFCSQSGTTYHILVTGFGGATGTFTMVLQSGGGSCTPSVSCQANPCAGIIRGDANGDGQVNNFDIDAFVQALTSGTCTANPTCRCRNDINQDGQVNNFDIDPFVLCLTGGGCH